MDVGAYPATGADITAPQVRKGVHDSGVAAVCDNNETVCKRLQQELERHGVAVAFRDAGLWEVCQHQDVWADADDERQWRVTQIEMNTTNPATRPFTSTGACACERLAC